MLRSRDLSSVVLCVLLGCASERESAGTEDDDSSSAAEIDASRRDASTRSDASTEREDDVEVDDDAETAGQTRSDAGAVRDAGTSARDASASDASTSALANFSFFVASLKAMQELSGSANGFGGDLRFGETGAGAGLRGADKICTTIAEKSMPGSGVKQWRAFLSATKGGADGGVVDAADRVGDGPWYDRVGRLVAMTKTDLIQVRPATADATIKNDLPNEDGVPNHNPDGTGEVDNHDILTGTNDQGKLYANDVRVTCNDWTKSAKDTADAPRVGHSWPRAGGGGRGGRGGAGMDNWMSALNEAGCGAGVSIIEMGPPIEANPTVGSGGGYGGIYCFALTP